MFLQRPFAWFCALLFAWMGMAIGQTVPTAARIESVPLELTMPERYQVAEILEPIRRVTLIAPADGFVRSIDVRLGATGAGVAGNRPARPHRGVGPAEDGDGRGQGKGSGAQERHATQAIRGRSGRSSRPRRRGSSWPSSRSIAARCARRSRGNWSTCRCAPGSTSSRGRRSPSWPISALKTLLPVDRRTSRPGRPLTVQVEGHDVAGKVQAILPLPAQFVALRELATPFAAAWVAVPNTKGELEPGLRVRPTTVPVTPIATVPKRAVKHG